MVSPARVGGRAGGATPGSIAGASFAEMLGQAERGVIRSDTPVRVAPGLELGLSVEQMERIGRAADVAAAHGAVRALVMIDGRALELDVGGREITGEVSFGTGGAVSEVDLVLDAGGGALAASEDAAMGEAAGAGLDGLGIKSASLMDLIGSLAE